MMQAPARWVLVSVVVGLCACTGGVGPIGPQGVQGPQGDPGPKGDKGDPGPMPPQGIYPQEMQASSEPQGCLPHNWTGTGFGAYSGTAIFPTRFTGGSPVVVTTIDGTSGGATAVRLFRPSSNRVTFRCNGDTADAINWLALTPGVHTISGHHVEAGVVMNATTGGTVSFTAPFTGSPVVLLTIDETAGTGPVFTRVIGTPRTTDFQYYLNTGATRLHWVAMDQASDYVLGRYHWTAGTQATTTCTTSCTIPLSGNTTEPLVYLTINDVNNSGADRIVLSGISSTAVTFTMNAATENVFYVLMEDLP